MNLKTYYDAAVAAESAVQAVLEEMDGLLQDGKKAEALQLKGRLEEAKSQAHEANEIYTLMRDGDEASPKARLFVPAGGKVEDKAAQTSRAAFEDMGPAERMAFVKAGGVVVDEA